MQDFYLPTEVITGCGTFEQLGKQAARFGRRALLVCGASSAQRSGLLARARELLAAAGVDATVFSRVAGEADLATVEAAIAAAREAGVEMVIGLGGGSPLDTAKAVAGMAPLAGTVWEYHGGRKLEAGGLPFIAVPTTAGTGAEVTKNAVLIDPHTEIKYSIRDDRWFARVAIVDPEATLSMPASVTASTGSDALCQAIESYTSIGAGPVTDALAARAIELIGGSLARACADGSDLAAREDMSMGSLMAGMAMATARLGGVHGMAHPLGSHFDIPHGVICGLLLPYTMEYNLPYATARYAHVAALMGVDTAGLSTEEAAAAAVAGVRNLVTQIGVPLHLREFGVKPDDFEMIIAESLPSGSLQHNPRPLAAADVRQILEMAL
jgi:alcohol dehydrogenase class IV